jgi:hypothetical protein
MDFWHEVGAVAVIMVPAIGFLAALILRLDSKIDRVETKLEAKLDKMEERLFRHLEYHVGRGEV